MKRTEKQETDIIVNGIISEKVGNLAWIVEHWLDLMPDDMRKEYLKESLQKRG